MVQNSENRRGGKECTLGHLVLWPWISLSSQEALDLLRFRKGCRRHFITSMGKTRICHLIKSNIITQTWWKRWTSVSFLAGLDNFSFSHFFNQDAVRDE